MKDIVIILILALLAGWIAKRMGQPAAVAQVLIGLIFGPPLLAWFEISDALKILGEIGVLLLLGLAGIQLGLAKLFKSGWKGIRVALFGMVFCFLGGYVLAVIWGSPNEEALYIAVALTATSIGISVQVLQQFQLLDKEIGEIVVAAAIIDDILALYLLAITHGVLSEVELSSTIIVSMVAAAFIFGGTFIVCRWLAYTGLRRLSAPIMRLFFSLTMIGLFGWISESFGYSLVVGSFFAGLGLGEGLLPDMREILIKHQERLVMVLVPFFFVHIGSQVQWQVLQDANLLILILGLVFIAVLGKLWGGYLGASSKNPGPTRLLIGASMVPRGEVVLVIANLGFIQGHISHHVLVALIIMTVLVAIVGPLLVAQFATRQLEAE